MQLASIVNDYLRPMREKRHELEKNPEYVDDVIREGSKKARIVAQDILAHVRELVKMY